MRPLVCVAPDGSLELWYRNLFGGFVLCKHPWTVFNKQLRENAMEGYDLKEDEPPEFWGREVLGEL